MFFAPVRPAGATARPSLPILLLAALASCSAAGVAPASAPPAGGTPRASAAPSAAPLPDTTHLAANAYALLDVIGARVSGHESGERAQRFGRDRFEAYGLDEVWFEPFPLLAWERGAASLTVRSPRELEGREVRVLSLGQVEAADVTAELVDAGHGTAEEIAALGDGVAGRIVLVRVGQPAGYGRSVHRTEKLTAAVAAGAAGFVMVAPEPGTLIQVGTATIGDEAAPVPAVGADFETGAWLLRVIAGSAEPVRARLVTTDRVFRTTAANVLGDLRGRSDETILVGGHLDSWDLGTGALDNGSGTLVVLEAARLLADRVRRTGERPARTIRFALWMGEELGLYGSRFHVAERRGRDALDRYLAVVNLDMVGAPTGFGAMGRPEAQALLAPLIAELGGRAYALDREVGTGGGLYSDHQPFLLEGLPILSLRSRWQEGAGRFYHSAGDTRDKLDETELARAGVVVAELLWRMATVEEWPLQRWSDEETGRRLEAMGLREPLERGGEWRWR